MTQTSSSEPSYGTSGGVPLTNEVIKDFAAEAEAGYDVSRLRPHTGPGPVDLWGNKRSNPRVEDGEVIVDGPSMTRDDLVQALMSHRDNDVHVYVPLESGGFVTLKIASVRYHSLSDMIHIETETHLDRELECE